MSLPIKGLLVILLLEILQDSLIVKTNGSIINEDPKQVKVHIPARARKTGGGRNLKQTTVSHPNIDRVEVYLTQTENLKGVSEKSQDIPAQAQKAGGSHKRIQKDFKENVEIKVTRNDRGLSDAISKKPSYTPANALEAGGSSKSFRNSKDNILRNVVITEDNQSLPVFEKNPESYVPVRAKKAGGTRKTKYDTNGVKAISEILKVGQNSKMKESENAGDYYSEENECPPGTFFHIRGHQCVPIKCNSKHYKRDPNDGKCTRKKQRFSNRLYDKCGANCRRIYGSWTGR